MHISDGLLTLPINTAGFAIAGTVCAIAMRRAGQALSDRQAPVLGVSAAFVFAAQMLNFPITSGTSGHFLGGVLMSLLLGPWLGCLVLGVVLTVQCLFFADGGLTALGTNTFNMGVVGAMGGYLLFRGVRALLPATREGYLAAAAVAAWASVIMASLACAVELVAAGVSSKPHLVLHAMGWTHALIGIGEAVITTSVLGVVIAARPDLVPSWMNDPARQQANGAGALAPSAASSSDEVVS